MAGRDEELLLDFARTRSDRAFAELVGRHANWVYSAALRSLGKTHLAEDVTQAVFLLLARQPDKAVGKSLSGWLFNVMRYAVINTRRSEGRRVRHENAAKSMAREEQEQTDDSLWNDMVPLLEDLMARLREKDRQLLLLRFYESRSLAEIAAVQGVTEDTARKRVTAAIEKLRGLFRAGGVIAPALVMAGILSERTTQAMPPALGSALTGNIAAPSAAASGMASQISRMFFVRYVSQWAASIALIFAVMISLTVGVVHAMFRHPSAGAAATSAATAPPPIATDPNFPFLVNVVTGSTQFRGGDGLTITEVRGTSSEFAVGNTYRIKGTYRLASLDRATITALNYPTDPKAQYGSGPGNQAVIQRGSGDFTVLLAVKYAGYPHLEMGPYNGGISFCSLFFGTGSFVAK